MRPTLVRACALPLALLTALAVLAGCGGDDNDKTSTSDSGAEFNEADVTFATDMIQHHAQALAMVDLTQGRELDPEFTDLASDIRDAQGPEIEQMTDWLEDWDRPVPSTMRDHANADEGDDMDDMDDMEGMDHGDDESADSGSDMPGMMSAEQMTELEDATGAEFRAMWLRMMVEHHEGAIEMAKAEIADGENGDAVDLARAIVTAQTAEIDRIEELAG